MMGCMLTCRPGGRPVEEVGDSSMPDRVMGWGTEDTTGLWVLWVPLLGVTCRHGPGQG